MLVPIIPTTPTEAWAVAYDACAEARMHLGHAAGSESAQVRDRHIGEASAWATYALVYAQAAVYLAAKK